MGACCSGRDRLCVCRSSGDVRGDAPVRTVLLWALYIGLLAVMPVLAVVMM